MVIGGWKMGCDRYIAMVNTFWRGFSMLLHSGPRGGIPALFIHIFFESESVDTSPRNIKKCFLSMYTHDMKTVIRTWVNNLAVRISKAFALNMGIDALLSKVTPENLHGETHTGSAVGKEM